MLRILAFDALGVRTIDDPDKISELILEDDTVVWADISQPHDEDLAYIDREFSLHPLSIEDASKPGQRPKLEQYNTHGFVVAYASTPQTCELIEIDMFVGPNWLITVHDRAPSGEMFDINVCQERVTRLKPDHLTSSFLFYVVLDQIVDTYFAAVDTLGEEVDEIEEHIFEDPDPEADEMLIQKQLLEVRKRLLRFRRRVVPLREVLLVLMREDVSWMSHDTRQYLQDVFDHVMRITDEIDVRRELLGNAVDAHLAMVSNHMNDIMKKMTSWGGILIVATLIAGIYGMNFENMPELHWQYGYAMALGSMVAVTTGLFLFFRRKRWL